MKLTPHLKHYWLSRYEAQRGNPNAGEFGDALAVIAGLIGELDAIDAWPEHWEFWWEWNADFSEREWHGWFDGAAPHKDQRIGPFSTLAELLVGAVKHDADWVAAHPPRLASQPQPEEQTKPSDGISAPA